MQAFRQESVPADNLYVCFSELYIYAGGVSNEYLTLNRVTDRLSVHWNRRGFVTTPTSFLTEEMRQQAIGQKSEPKTIDVEKGAIIKFAQAIEDDNPVFNDEQAARDSRYGGLIAPPTFLRSVGVDRPAYPYDMPFNRLLDGGSDWEYFHPVRAGDRITAVSEIADINERNGRMGLMIITTIVVTYRNQFDQVAATQTSTSIRY